MKTLKLSMIAAVLTVGLLSLTLSSSLKAEHPMKSFKTIEMTFAEAIQNQGLLVEMYQQLNSDFLNNNEQNSHTVEVYYMGFVVQITGTHGQWVWFFQRGWVLATSGNLNER